MFTFEISKRIVLTSRLRLFDRRTERSSRDEDESCHHETNTNNQYRLYGERDIETDCFNVAFTFDRRTEMTLTINLVHHETNMVMKRSRDELRFGREIEIETDYFNVNYF